LRPRSPKYVLALSAAMLVTGIACAALGLSAARAAKQSMRPVAIVRYSGPLSGELIENDSQLRQVLPEVKLDSMTLGQAIDALRRMSGANIFVNWYRVGEAYPGLNPNTPVHLELRLKNVTLGQVLSKVLESAESPASRIGCRMRYGIITISDGSPKLGSIGRWYYVQDLINHPAHTCFARPGGTPQEIEYDLTTMIMEAIDPDSWRDAGGEVGSIRSWAGRLIIFQTPENHQKIESLLANLRKGP